MKKNTIMWLVLAALGLFIVIGHNLAISIVCKVIGVGLLAAGIIGIVHFVQLEKRGTSEVAQLLGSIAFTGLGLWVLLDTVAFITFLNVVLGLIMIVSGVLGMIRGMRDEKDKVTLIFSGVGIALGLIIACSNAATTWFTVFEGLGLIYAAITGFISEKRNG